jgi:hypothetical protein
MRLEKKIPEYDNNHYRCENLKSCIFQGNFWTFTWQKNFEETHVKLATTVIRICAA